MSCQKKSGTASRNISSKGNTIILPYQVKTTPCLESLLDAVFYCVLMLYCPTNYADKIYLPKRLIEKATNENWLDTLCYFVWLKAKHHRPIFYNYTLRGLSKIIGCSPNTIKSHISKLKSEGLASELNGNLILISNNTFRKQDPFFVSVGVNYKKSNQRNFLRWTLIKNNLFHQYKAIEKKNNNLNLLKGNIKNTADYKSFKKAVVKYPDVTQLESSIQSVLNLSNKKIGFICNRSKDTGIKIQKAFNKLKLIKSVKRVKPLDMPIISRKMFFAIGLDASHFISPQGFVFKRLPNETRLRKAVV